MALVGNLKDLKLANIIQINCIERNTARVMVKSGEQVGNIYFANGGIVHAEFGPYIGERAVHEMLALTDGEFKVEAGIAAPAHTVSQPWNSVVLEGLRLIDEKKVLATSLPEQLISSLSELKNVRNVFVLNYDGNVLEGELDQNPHPQFLNFIWYKVKKLLNLFYSDIFQYIVLREKDGYYFIFESSPNLIVIETNKRVIIPEFTLNVKKILKSFSSIK